MSFIDIILPFKNEVAYIEKAILSILPQLDFINQVIAIDDYSDDFSYKIVEKYLSNTKKLLLIKNTECLGTLNSIRKGIEVSTAKYVSIISANDFVHTSLYKKAINDLQTYKNEPPGLWSSLVWDLYPNGVTKISVISLPSVFSKKISPQESSKLLLKMGPWFEGASLIFLRRALIENRIAFRSELSFFSDTITCALVVEKYGCYFRAEPLAYNRVQPSSFNLIEKESFVKYNQVLNFINQISEETWPNSLLIERFKSRLLASYLASNLDKNNTEFLPNTPINLKKYTSIFNYKIICYLINIIFVLYCRRFDIVSNLQSRIFLFSILRAKNILKTSKEFHFLIYKK